MRIVFSIILIALIVALIACYRNARRSDKTIASSVGLLIGALLPPLIGNLIIITSSEETLSTIGYYIYFLGMDAVMFALLRFTLDYCAISGTKHRRFCVIAYMLLGIDVIQYAVNLFTNHAFGTEPIEFSGAIYYRLNPYLGQTFHRILDYGILAAVMIIFIIKTVRSPKINSERYSVILAAMIITTVWETAYIFSRTPIDRAMIGFGVFGLLVYYLALFYRPMRLLDSMLANMASLNGRHWRPAPSVGDARIAAFLRLAYGDSISGKNETFISASILRKYAARGVANPSFRLSDNAGSKTMDAVDICESAFLTASPDGG